MSNRQERIARKARQRAGEDAYMHLKPTQATPPAERAVRVSTERFGGDRIASARAYRSKRHLRALGLLPPS